MAYVEWYFSLFRIVFGCFDRMIVLIIFFKMTIFFHSRSSCRENISHFIAKFNYQLLINNTFHHRHQCEYVLFHQKMVNNNLISSSWMPPSLYTISNGKREAIQSKNEQTKREQEGEREREKNISIGLMKFEDKEDK